MKRTPDTTDEEWQAALDERKKVAEARMAASTQL